MTTRINHMGSKKFVNELKFVASPGCLFQVTIVLGKNSAGMINKWHRQAFVHLSLRVRSLEVANSSS